MIVKGAHRRPEGPRLKSDGSPLTSDHLNVSNYLKPQTSPVWRLPSDYLCILKSVILTQLKMESIFLTQHVELKMS